MKKASTANTIGRRAFNGGVPCDPNIPFRHYKSLGKEIGLRLMESWMNGWTDESLMQSLPDGMLV
jgi:uncharacterized protein YjlB